MKTKLGWLDKALSETRADITDADSPGDDSMLKTFDVYVKHVRDELQAGQDISYSIDTIYLEACR
ncbi:hypothetical protein I3U60_05240 [Mycobacteroides abscessus subsp. massiliense]|nr:hypothetical protein [Mycobacteroides abscessus subsp. massiliense]